MIRSCLLLFAITLITFSANAQPADAWTEYMTPSGIHKMLEGYVGDFDMEITMWMSKDQDPVVFNVKSKHSMILGGRFIEMKQFGAMMGMDYQSVMTMGFNNSDKRCTLTAITNMGTGTLTLEGSLDEVKKIANLSGRLTNPVDKMSMTVRQQITFVDNNTILVESFDQKGDGKETKTVQYKYSRIL